MSVKKVLVFPCGSEIGLEINRALAHSTHFRLVGASSVDDHGRHVYRHYVGGLPHIDAPDFIDALNRVIAAEQIDFVVPAHDSAVLKMAEQADAIRARVVTSPAETCRICRSKAATYEALQGCLAIPQRYAADAALPFPVFLKPDVGQGSKGTALAHTPHEVQTLLQRDPSLLVLEYLPGREYTVDCFTDRHGRLRFAEGRERARILNGISVNARPLDDPRFRALAERINARLELRGVWFYQVKERADGELALLEVAPRVAGTMALLRVSGVNFIELSLYDAMDCEVAILRNPLRLEIDRALCSRYALDYPYDWVYLDFDDTLIVDGAVNGEAMRLLYQWRNQGKRVVLLSKHRFDIQQSLARHAISPALFERIVILDAAQEKADFIDQRPAIFVDDSFAERRKVFERCGIAVFAPDALEALIDWRV